VEPKFRLDIRNFKSVYLLNLLVATAYWLIFHPGLFSADSFAAYEMAKSGDLSNSFTASWALYVRYFSLLGQAISLLTLINVLILSYAVTRLCMTLFEEKSAKFVAFLMCLSPGVAGIGITLWHDIPMTSGFLLLLSSLIRFQKMPVVTWMVWVDLLLSALLITFRPNGLPTLTLILFFAIALRKLRVFLRPIAISFLVGGAVTLLSSYIGIGQPPINRYFSQEWMRNDIACFAAKSEVSNFEKTTKISRVLYMGWKSEEACIFLNRFSLSETERKDSLAYVPTSWLRLAKNEPSFVLETHLRRNAYLNPFPIFGIPSTPFLHTNIEFENKGITWTFHSVAQEFRMILRAWNYLRPITGWVGLWLAVIIGIYLKEQNSHFQLLLSFAVCVTIILFVFAPIPDGRYGLFILISGQATLMNELYLRLSKIRKANDK
jgi:hypothetical protein